MKLHYARIEIILSKTLPSFGNDHTTNNDYNSNNNDTSYRKGFVSWLNIWHTGSTVKHTVIQL